MTMEFNPNNAALHNSGIFGLITDYSSSKLAILPVPWDATSSGITGSNRAPKAIFEASKQTEMLIPELGNFFEKGIFMMEIDKSIELLNSKASKYSKKVIDSAGLLENSQLKRAADFVNNSSEQINDFVYDNTSKIIRDNKIAAVVGGEHSVSLGSIRSHAENYANLSVLQFDAHHDLRDSFESLKYSHGSVMFNVIEEVNISKLVQVGIRAISPDENQTANNSRKIMVHSMQQIQDSIFNGEAWSNYCDNIVGQLTDNVYISFDIDGLEITYCPNTGTPVPGGMDYNAAIFLIKRVIDSGKKIVGFDLVEVNSVAEHDINSTTAANLLYYLCGCCLQ